MLLKQRLAIFAVTVLLVVVSMASCAKPAAPPMTDGFCCKLTLTYGETVYQGTLDRNNPSETVLAVTKPDTLKGLTMTWNGEAVTMSYAGMSMMFEEGSVPVGAAVKVLCRTLDLCRDRAESRSVIEGELEGLAYTVAFDDRSGWPLTLHVPSVPLKVTFSEWTRPTD